MLLVGTMLGGVSSPLIAQEAGAQAAPATAQPAPATAQAAPVQVNRAPVTGMIRSISVRGAERLEPATVISYSNLSPGQEYSAESLDTALKDLYATELFSDVVITGAETGALVLQIKENPVINRIILEGNKRIKDDKIQPEIRLAPRQIFTRSKVRSDVDRIIELYKRGGRFAATVEPKIVQLDQNRVDLVFEINEGPTSKVRAINIIGNDQYGDGRLRKEMYTKEAGGVLGIFKSNDSYDPDRLAADQQKLRAFYLTEGYADFRVVSALAELTPDRRDFVITYVVEEGPRYKFGTIQAESGLRDLSKDVIERYIRLKPGDWFNAKAVEDVVAGLSEIAGAQGYAFSDINPAYDRDAEKKLMNILFRVNESPRVYIERIDINGNTITRDKVVRREFRVNEGDAFNAIKIKRSQDRIQSLGFFQEKMEIKQTQGSSPDRVILALDLEEKSTGELQLSAGYSSLEKFIVSANIAQRNFLGKGQEVNAGVNWSRYSRSAQIGFVEPYLFDKNILLGGELFRRDFNSFSRQGNERNTTYSQLSTGASVRLGFPITEFISLGTRYQLVQDKLTLNEDQFFTDPDGAGPLGSVCDPLLAGRYLCDQLGTTLSSVVGYSLIFDNRNGIRATRGQRIVLSQDFAGLGGDVKYARTRIDATKYFKLPKDFLLSVHGEAGYIHPLQSDPGEGRDAIRLSDRFFGAQMRGFDIRGIGPRIQRIRYDAPNTLATGGDPITDAIGGRAYYMGRIELEIPVSANIRSLGLRPSAFIDVGSVFGIKKPSLTDLRGSCIGPDGPDEGTDSDIQVLNPGDNCNLGLPGVADDFTFIPNSGFREFFLGNSPKPRLAIGVGVNWNSPFGPLRIDIAKALIKQEGDEVKLFSFNVGTQF
ncbi:MAG: outer membrane protein assembly factor BamA [Sphingomonas bacterium]|nr:outer membrane protein assembly factor BamA [Sphingomonas bacterium]